MSSPYTLFQEYKRKLESLYPPQEADHLVVWLFEEYLGLNRKDITPDRVLDSVPPFLEEAMLELLKNRPIQYVIGKAPFYGYELRVSPDVLIPRNETEELVYLILKHNPRPNLRILDIGTGSGCIPIALALEMKQSKVFGLDVSDKALEVARENNRLLGANVTFLHCDILNQMPDVANFDILVSNPPYVKNSERQKMNPNVVDHEPHLALFVADTDPLVFYKAIGEKGKKLLKSNGTLYFEINEALGKETRTLLTSMGYADAEVIQDLNGKDRFVKALWLG